MSYYNNFYRRRAMAIFPGTFILLQSCSFFKTPEPRLPRRLPVKVFNITPNRPALQVTGVYYNPNDFAFTFTGGELDVKLDTLYLGHVKLDTVMTVPAHALFNVPVVVEPDFAKLGSSGINLADTVLLSFSGRMTGKKGGDWIIAL